MDRRGQLFVRVVGGIYSHLTLVLLSTNFVDTNFVDRRVWEHRCLQLMNGSPGEIYYDREDSGTGSWDDEGRSRLGGRYERIV